MVRPPGHETISSTSALAEKLGVRSPAIDEDVAGNQIVLELQQLRPIDLRETDPVPDQITVKELMLSVVRIFALGNVALDTSSDFALAYVDESFLIVPQRAVEARCVSWQ